MKIVLRVSENERKSRYGTHLRLVLILCFLYLQEPYIHKAETH